MQRSVNVELIIHAPPERVFEAWTNPVELARWWGDDEFYRVIRCEMDLRPGGKWAAHGVFKANDKPFTISGEIMSVDAPFGLAFTWHQSWTPGVLTMIEFFFMRDLEGTLVKVRHVGDLTDDAADGHRKGWEQVFGWMKAYIEPPAQESAESDFEATYAALMAKEQATS